MPQIAVVSTQSTNAIQIGNVSVANRGNLLSLSIPLSSAKSAQGAAIVTITRVTLDGRIPSDLAVPWLIGPVAVSDARHLNASFSLDNIAPGTSHTVVVEGTYKQGESTHALSLTVPFVVPSRTNVGAELLAARVIVDTDLHTGHWKYRLVNDEPTNSGRFINSFQLSVSAPFVVAETPKGWDVQTDNFQYVLWYLKDSAVAKAIVPGASVDGFAIRSSRLSSAGAVFTVTSWNQTTKAADRVKLGTVLAPAGNE